jgi:hypothetical protein
MARGWESKSVEAQMESVEDRKRQTKPQLTPKQMEQERRRDSFLLQRTRMLHQLEQCHDARYRKTLVTGLEYLENELKALGWTK